jgi:RNA polymerase subunit RPABC4/transcription elongation factor Spt4
MNTVQPTPSVVSKAATQAVIQSGNEIRRGERKVAECLPGAAELRSSRSGYGLPCAKCKTYYAAGLTACPVCKDTERVSPTAGAVLATAPSSLAEATALGPDEAALEAERERFLREFKSQVYASHMQINAAASFRCSKEENHQGGVEPAAICQCCYNHLQERVDLMEAALHMDLKEAGQVVYDAVWSDPSDPNKTYLNAAQALLTILRKRAGIATVLGPLQPLPH